MDVPPELLAFYGQSLELQPRVEKPSSTAIRRFRSRAGWRSLSNVQRPRVRLRPRYGPGPEPGIAPATAIRRRTQHNCPVHDETALRGRVVAGTTGADGSRLGAISPFHCGVAMKRAVLSSMTSRSPPRGTPSLYGRNTTALNFRRGAETEISDGWSRSRTSPESFSRCADALLDGLASSRNEGGQRPATPQLPIYIFCHGLR